MNRPIRHAGGRSGHAGCDEEPRHNDSSADWRSFGTTQPRGMAAYGGFATVPIATFFMTILALRETVLLLLLRLFPRFKNGFYALVYLNPGLAPIPPLREKCVVVGFGVADVGDCGQTHGIRVE